MSFLFWPLGFKVGKTKPNPSTPQPRRCYRWCRKLVETRILNAGADWYSTLPGKVQGARKLVPWKSMDGWKLVQIHFLLSLYIDIQTATFNWGSGGDLTGATNSTYRSNAHRKQLMRYLFRKNLMDISTNQMLWSRWSCFFKVLFLQTKKITAYICI